MPRKPHIVIFNPDSYRGDVLGHLGNPGAVTPALDAIVAEGGGVSYANAFAQNPVCTPSRCSFMTGWYPHVHGHRSMRNMLKEHEPSLLHVLRREGYLVWWGGKNDLVAVETPDDFMKYCDVKARPEPKRLPFRRPAPLAPDDPARGAFYGGVMRRDPDGDCLDGDAAYVESAAEMIRNRPADRPLCLYLPISRPHPAYAVEEDFYDLIDPDLLPPRIPAPDADSRHPPVLEAMRRAFRADRIGEDRWRDVKRIYYAMCAKVDSQFGQVVAALKEAGIYDDTLIVFLSDHGDFAGDYSLPEKTHVSLQDSLLRVPFLVKPPADVPTKPGVRHELAELVDMTATIYDLLGIDPGYDCQGRSLRGSLAGEGGEMRDAVFAEVGSRKGEGAFSNPPDTGKPRPPDSFYGIQGAAARPFQAEGSYAVMCRTRRFKYVRRGYNDWHELYDLEADPGELLNLSGQPEWAETEREMQMRLLDFFMRTGDVLPHKKDPRNVR